MSLKSLKDRAREIERLQADLDLRNQTACDRKEIIAKLEAEIERLQSDNIAKSERITELYRAQKSAFLNARDHDGHMEEVCRQLREEIERLRAALEEIASGRWWGNDGVSVETREATIARRTLYASGSGA